MANGTMAKPNLLTDPGFLYYAPVGTALPVHTVAGGVFTDTWPVAWVPLGMTDGGTTVTHSLTVEAIEAAEVFDPLAYRTTGRSAQVEMSLKNFTAAVLSKALNGAATDVTGAADTLLTHLVPPDPGDEVRAMLGFESLDSTVRWVAFQVINSGDVALAFQKAPANANIPWTAMCEKPVANAPVEYWTAGDGRG